LFIFYHYDTLIVLISIGTKTRLYLKTGMSPLSLCHTLAINDLMPGVLTQA